MQLVLKGMLLTPFRSQKRTFHLKGCKWIISQAHRIHHTKIQTAIPMYPFAYGGYVGMIEVSYTCQSLKVAQNKVQDLKRIRRIGPGASESLGLIQWLDGHVTRKESRPKRKQRGRIKIRKGLPSNLPQAIQDLILYGLLHDFIDNQRHISKLNTEPPIADQELLQLLRQSHAPEPVHPLVKQFQRYDRMAASMTRNHKAPRMNRYNWKADETAQTVDFTLLAAKIQAIVDSQNVFKLYLFVHQSQELELLNEDFNYGHTSLRYHLLLIANMMVRDYLHGYLDDYLKQMATRKDTGEA